MRFQNQEILKKINDIDFLKIGYKKNEDARRPHLDGPKYQLRCFGGMGIFIIQYVY